MQLDSAAQIEWVPSDTPNGVSPKTVHFGKGAQPIQVALAESSQAPSRASLRTLFQDRKGRLPIFVIVAVSHGDSVSIYGPDPDSETIVLKSATAQAVLNSILEQENEISAYQRAIFLWRSKQTTDMVGFTNNGLFASHFIRTSINRHAKWSEAQKRSAELQNLRDKELITGLGFEISASPSSTLLLSAKGQEKRVVAILLDRSENFEAKSPRLQASPVEWSLGIAVQQGAPWVIAIKDSQLRLYPAKDGVGVGQKSQAETYFEIDLLTVDEEKVGLLDLIFSAEALAEGGTAEGLLSDSKKFAAEVGVRLRERVYEQVVPPLATEIANQLRAKGHELDSKGLQLSYELTLRVLFRLLFQAYAEDRGLLPAGRNEIFDSNSMKHWAEHLLNRDSSIPFGDSSTIWFDLMQVWDAIDQGNPEMQIPAYNGGLFGSDPDLHQTGSLIRTLSIPDRVMGPALRALVVDDLTEDGVPGAVDFRSLSVREFGTIYEGLLESSLSVADQNLTVDSKGAWVPAKEKDQILAKENEVYFHSASGERKATGSYYTPSFIVDHLIERSVEPALNDHLAKVKELIDHGDQAAAYKLFFDFRVADLAMGSAHFLVAAIDKIESIMRSFLVQPGNNIEGVNAELIRLEEAAKKALGKDEAAYAEIERASLLRRQIARRCIYGLDINPLAVELSRLAIWIHTFVPGLPMSSLEHNLVCANSLTGIGSVDEGLNALIPERAKGQSTLFDGIVEQSLSEAKSLLEEVASADEADKTQALEAAVVAKQARQAASKSKMIFDLAVANRNGVISSGAALSEVDLLDLYSNQKVLELVAALQPAHMPYLFPEVFLRDNPGFNALVGNPPWEKVKVEEQVWWGVHFPGLRGLPQKQKVSELAKLRSERPDLEDSFRADLEAADLFRKAILKSPFPGLGSGGDPNLFHIFSWRFIQLLRDGGRTGVALPRGAMTTSALFDWRKHVLNTGSFESVVFGINNRNWLFDKIHGQTEVALVVISMDRKGLLRFTRRFNERDDFVENRDDLTQMPRQELESLSKDLVPPVFSARQGGNIFSRFYEHPRIEQLGPALKFSPTNEMHGTKQKPLFDFSSSVLDGYVPIWSGAAFNIWDSRFGDLYAQAEPTALRSFLKERHLSAISRRSSIHFGKPPLPLPIDSSRIVFRDTSSGTNRRTVIVCLAPPGVGLIHRSPYLVFANGSPSGEAFVLGVMSSIPFDWLARCWVEGTFSFEILTRLPFPESAFNSQIGNRIIEISANLADRYSEHSDWFNKTGARRVQDDPNQLIAELDGLVAAAYGLRPNDLSEIFESFHPGWSDPERLEIAVQALEEVAK